MRETQHRTIVAGVAAGILCVTAAQTATQAADHREAPLIKQDQAADIADVYAFVQPDNDQRLVLAMTVNPFTAPSENVTYEFSSNVRYTFLVDNSGNGKADRKIEVTFSDPVDGPQEYEVRISGGVKFSGLATPGTEEPEPIDPIITEGPSGIRAFAGQRDDPFFFDVVGFSRFLAGTGGFSGSDGFAGYNVSAIVIELPTHLVSNGQTDLQVWGITERAKKTERRGNKGKLEKHNGKWQRIERMGNPAINTALIPLARKDFFNIGDPKDDAADFAGDIVASLTALGTNEENIAILASVAVPDTLKLNTAATSGYPNGRTPADDVVDTLLFFIFNQTPVSDGVDANDREFPAGFPYLAAPHQPE